MIYYSTLIVKCIHRKRAADTWKRRGTLVLQKICVAELLQSAEEENELVDLPDEPENKIEEEFVWVFHDDEH